MTISKSPTLLVLKILARSLTLGHLTTHSPKPCTSYSRSTFPPLSLLLVKRHWEERRERSGDTYNLLFLFPFSLFPLFSLFLFLLVFTDFPTINASASVTNLHLVLPRGETSGNIYMYNCVCGCGVRTSCFFFTCYTLEYYFWGGEGGKKGGWKGGRTEAYSQPSLSDFNSKLQLFLSLVFVMMFC